MQCETCFSCCSPCLWLLLLLLASNISIKIKSESKWKWQGAAAQATWQPTGNLCVAASCQLLVWQFVRLQLDGKIWIAIAKCGTGFRSRTGSIRRVRVRMRGDTFDDMSKLGRDFDLPTNLVDWFMCHINTHTQVHTHTGLAIWVCLSWRAT